MTAHHLSCTKWRAVGGMWDADDDCCERRFVIRDFSFQPQDFFLFYLDQLSNSEFCDSGVSLLSHLLILGVLLITLVLTVRVIVRQILTVNETATTFVERPA